MRQRGLHTLLYLMLKTAIWVFFSSLYTQEKRLKRKTKERSGNANQVCLTLKTTQNLPEKDSWYKNS